MTAFRGMIDTLFADPNLSAAATYEPAAGGSIDLRVILDQPSDVVPLAGSQAASLTTQIDVRRSDVAQPVEGDRITVGARAWIVQGEPMLDELDLVWRLDTYPAGD